MRLLPTFLAACLTLSFATCSYAADDQLLKLDPKRDSAPYKAQILGLLKKTEGFRWEHKADGMGYVISQETGMKSNWNSDTFVNGIFVNVKKFYYGTKVDEYVGYARQSNFLEFVEIYGWKEPDKQIHIKYNSSSDTMSLYYLAYPDRPKFTFNKVDKFFTETPSGKGNKSGKTAEENDLIF